MIAGKSVKATACGHEPDFPGYAVVVSLCLISLLSRHTGGVSIFPSALNMVLAH